MRLLRSHSNYQPLCQHSISGTYYWGQEWGQAARRINQCSLKPAHGCCHQAPLTTNHSPLHLPIAVFLIQFLFGEGKCTCFSLLDGFADFISLFISHVFSGTCFTDPLRRSLSIPPCFPLSFYLSLSLARPPACLSSLSLYRSHEWLSHRSSGEQWTGNDS